MKERANSVKKDRTYDAEGYTQRVGCLCFKTESEKKVCAYPFSGNYPLILHITEYQSLPVT